MTAKENVERTIAVLADRIAKTESGKEAVAAARAMAELYSAINADVQPMYEVLQQLAKSCLQEKATGWRLDA